MPLKDSAFKIQGFVSFSAKQRRGVQAPSPAATVDNDRTAFPRTELINPPFEFLHRDQDCPLQVTRFPGKFLPRAYIQDHHAAVDCEEFTRLACGDGARQISELDDQDDDQNQKGRQREERRPPEMGTAFRHAK